MMVGLGVCFTTNGIVGMSLALEMIPQEQNEVISYFYRKNAISIYLVSETCYICAISFNYQFIDNSWRTIQIFSLIVVILLLNYSLIFLTESPQYLYSKGKYDEARKSLKYISEFNGSKNWTDDFKFDKELQAEI
jgi:hypothetical protein